jgi:hypothetical protein
MEYRKLLSNLSHRLSRTRATAATAFIGVVLALGPVSAQQTTSVPSYDVELVIFRHLGASGTDEALHLESTVNETIAIPYEDPVPFESPLETSPTNTQTFPTLPASKFKLTAIEDSLRRSRNYQPLAHIGWTQPGYARDAAPFLAINTFAPSSSGLTGRLALSRGRYLHLTLDLMYIAPSSAADAGQRYVLRQSRRMRSNERHYIDHPKFGVIALVTPSTG